MSATTDSHAVSSLPSTSTYKSVASMEEIHVAHDIVISDFAKWRVNFELLGPVEGTLNLPITNGEGDGNSEVRGVSCHPLAVHIIP